MKYFTVFLSCVVLFPSLAFSENSASSRKNKPLQIQVIGPWGGTLLGYHVNKNIFFGITDRSGAGFRSDPNSDVKSEQQSTPDSRLLSVQNIPDGITKSSYEEGRSQTFQIRWSPFKKSGYFLAFGGYQDAGEVEQLTLDSRSRTIGSNIYSNTDLNIKLKREAILAPLLGMGWNWILDNGFSWGLDMTAGVFNDQTTNLTVDVTTTNSLVSASDLREEEGKLKQGASFSAGSINLNMGWNFK